MTPCPGCRLRSFDLLHLDGFDLTSCPLIKRKSATDAHPAEGQHWSYTVYRSHCRQWRTTIRKTRGSESGRHGNETKGQRLRIYALSRLVKSEHSRWKDDDAKANRNLGLKNNNRRKH